MWLDEEVIRKRSIRYNILHILELATELLHRLGLIIITLLTIALVIDYGKLILTIFHVYPNSSGLSNLISREITFTLLIMPGILLGFALIGIESFSIPYIHKYQSKIYKEIEEKEEKRTESEVH